MKKRQFYTCLLIMYLGISCSPSRKSAAYFQENKTAIAELRTYFNQLYTQQPFSAGFTDKTFKYYVMQVMTDTLRAVYNNEKRKDELWENVRKFHYDTALLKKMAKRMKDIKCLWIGKSDYYFGEHPEKFDYISFKSADKAFRENKYYMLVFLEHSLEYPEFQERIDKGTFVPVDSLVYYTTTSRYR